MTNDQTGRTPRQTTGGSPAASTIMIIVTVVAVVIGFFILKTIRDDNGGTSGTPTATTAAGPTTPTTVPGAATTAPPTTLPADVKTGTAVVVANASGVGGAAGKLTTALTTDGFTMGKATDGTGAKLATTVVYYDTTNPAALAVATTLARTMGTAAPEALPSPVPVSGGKLADGTGVLVMLGKDKAGKELAAMTSTTAAGAAGATTTAAKAATTTAKA